MGSETSSLDEMSVTSSTAASEHSLVRSEDRSNRFSGDNYNRRKVCSTVYISYKFSFQVLKEVEFYSPFLFLTKESKFDLISQLSA